MGEGVTEIIRKEKHSRPSAMDQDRKHLENYANEMGIPPADRLQRTKPTYQQLVTELRVVGGRTLTEDDIHIMDSIRHS